jgi:hypothetical protein
MTVAGGVLLPGGLGMSAAEQLRDLSHAVRRLTPDRRDPERYFLDKDSIAKALVRLAHKLEGWS